MFMIAYHFRHFYSVQGGIILIFTISTFHVARLYCVSSDGTWDCALVADEFYLETDSKKELENYPYIR